MADPAATGTLLSMPLRRSMGGCVRPIDDGRVKPSSWIPFNDLHHVATGYGTDVLGEAEIGAWELLTERAVRLATLASVRLVRVPAGAES